MSIPLPISVWTKTSHGYFDLTSQVRDLSFRATAPGGFASAEFTLGRRLDIPADEVEYYAKVYVHDSRSDEVLWEGWQEDPNRSAGATAGTYRITAMGPSARTHDRTEPVVYIDRAHPDWVPGAGSAKYIRTDIGDPVNMKAEAGSTWAIGDAAGITYSKVAECGQMLARVQCTWDTGLTNANSEVQLLTSVNGAAGTVRTSATWNTAGGSLTASRAGANDIPVGENWAFLRVIRPSVAGSGGDTVWAEFGNIRVRAILKDASGNDITTGYGNNSVLASEVVKDLLGRLLTMFDGPNATVATTSYAIDSLVYLDGADAQKILDDLAVLEPGYYWAAWESSWTGKNRFEYVAWPTTVRYEVDLSAGIEAPASGADLFDGVRVRYRDRVGNIVTAKVIQTVPELVQAGFSRVGWIDLGDEINSDNNATQAANGFLTEHSTPPNAGRLIITGPVLDRVLGRFVYPWELKPGCLVAVRGILPRKDALNSNPRDAVTTYRVRAVEFNAASAAAILELDSYARTVSRTLSKVPATDARRR